MTRLLLVEDVFLLGHDEESGKNTASLGLPGALAGALLLDLAEQELIVVDDDGVRATGASTSDPLLAKALAVIAEESKTRKVPYWLDKLPRKLKPFDRSVGEALVARGVLGEQEGKVLGLFTTTRWPERDPQPEQQLRAELREALLGEARPSTRVLLLCGLLQPYGMIDGLVDKPERKQARARAKELTEQAESTDAIASGIGDSVRAAQLAVMTTLVATTAATTATTVTGSN